jgi:hypothetical protein
MYVVLLRSHLPTADFFAFHCCQCGVNRAVIWWRVSVLQSIPYYIVSVNVRHTETLEARISPWCDLLVWQRKSYRHEKEAGDATY